LPYHNNWKDNGLYRKFTGEITGGEILESNLSIHGDPRFDGINYVLNDFISIVEFDVNNTDINIISTIDNVAALSKQKLKIAIVATNTDLLKWVNVYLNMMQDSPYETAVFSTCSDALNWAS